MFLRPEFRFGFRKCTVKLLLLLVAKRAATRGTHEFLLCVRHSRVELGGVEVEPAELTRIVRVALIWKRKLFFLVHCRFHRCLIALLDFEAKFPCSFAYGLRDELSLRAHRLVGAYLDCHA